jgi:hypothetical protein
MDDDRKQAGAPDGGFFGGPVPDAFARGPVPSATSTSVGPPSPAHIQLGRAVAWVWLAAPTVWLASRVVPLPLKDRLTWMAWLVLLAAVMATAVWAKLETAEQKEWKEANPEARDRYMPEIAIGVLLVVAMYLTYGVFGFIGSEYGQDHRECQRRSEPVSATQGSRAGHEWFNQCMRSRGYDRY